MYAIPGRSLGETPPAPDRRPPVGSSDRFHRVLALAIEDDDAVCTLYGRLLGPIAREFLLARNVADGLRLAVTRQPELILLDLQFNGRKEAGLELLAALRQAGVIARVVIVSGFVTTDAEVQARRFGALALLRKPASLGTLNLAIQTALGSRGPAGDDWAAGFDGTHAERWVSIILGALENPQDPHLCEELCRRGAVSMTTLKRTCKRVGTKPHDMRDLARVLCVLVWSRRLGVPALSLLHAGDDRTLGRLFRRAGCENGIDDVSVREYLHRQRFVAQDNVALILLRKALLADSSD